MRTKKQHHESIFSKYIGDMFEPETRRRIEEAITLRLADGSLVKEVDFRRMLERVGNKYQVGRMMAIVTERKWSVTTKRRYYVELADATYLFGFHNPNGNYRCGFIAIKKLKKLLSDGEIKPGGSVFPESLKLLYDALRIEAPKSIRYAIRRARLAKAVRGRKPERCPCCGRLMPKKKA